MTPTELLAKLGPIFTQYGVAGIVRRVTNYGTLNTTTGAMDNVTVTDFPVTYIEDKKTLRFILETAVVDTAQSIILLGGPSAVVPTVLDKFVRNSEEFTIKRVDPSNFQGVPIAYMVSLT